MIGISWLLITPAPIQREWRTQSRFNQLFAALRVLTVRSAPRWSLLHDRSFTKMPVFFSLSLERADIRTGGHGKASLRASMT